MNVKIDMLGGNCPVQAEGTIDGDPFYFRARGEHWSMSVGNDNWTVSIRYSHDTFGAGWMSEEEARRFIYVGAQMYLTAKINNTITPELV